MPAPPSVASAAAQSGTLHVPRPHVVSAGYCPVGYYFAVSCMLVLSSIFIGDFEVLVLVAAYTIALSCHFCSAGTLMSGPPMDQFERSGVRGGPFSSLPAATTVFTNRVRSVPAAAPRCWRWFQSLLLIRSGSQEPRQPRRRSTRTSLLKCIPKPWTPPPERGEDGHKMFVGVRSNGRSVLCLFYHAAGRPSTWRVAGIFHPRCGFPCWF